MGPLKLLVVEDDALSLELMTEVFTSLKAEVRPVSDSEESGKHRQSGKVRWNFPGSGDAASEWF